MKLLLDTCSLLWALQGPGQLSAPARRALKDPDNSGPSEGVWPFFVSFELKVRANAVCVKHGKTTTN